MVTIVVMIISSQRSQPDGMLVPGLVEPSPVVIDAAVTTMSFRPYLVWGLCCLKRTSSPLLLAATRSPVIPVVTLSLAGPPVHHQSCHRRSGGNATLKVENNNVISNLKADNPADKISVVSRYTTIYYQQFVNVALLWKSLNMPNVAVTYSSEMLMATTKPLLHIASLRITSFRV